MVRYDLQFDSFPSEVISRMGKPFPSIGHEKWGSCSKIANSMVKAMGLAPAVFGPLMNIIGSALASSWDKQVP